MQRECFVNNIQPQHCRLGNATVGACSEADKASLTEVSKAVETAKSAFEAVAAGEVERKV